MSLSDASYLEFSADILSSIGQGTQNQEHLATFSTLCKQYCHKSTLEGLSKQNSTDFFQSLCPKIISSILDCSVSQKAAQFLNQFLNQSIQLFVKFFSSDESEFLNQSRRIFLDNSCKFYYSTTPSSLFGVSETSPFLKSNQSELFKSGFLSKSIAYLASDDLIPSDKFLWIASISLLFKSYQSDFSDFFKACAHRQIKLVQDLDESNLRSLNEKSLSQFSDTIRRHIPHQSKLYSQVSDSEFSLSLKFALCPYINKRYQGLTNLKTILCRSPSDRLPLLQKIKDSGLVDRYFEDPHHETIVAFSTVLQMLISSGLCAQKELQMMWQISLKPYTETAYFTAWSSLYSSLSAESQRQFWSIALQTKEFTEQSIVFLGSIVGTSLSSERKSLTSILLQQKDKSLTSSIATTIGEAVKDERDLSQEVQNHCFLMLKDTKETEKAVQILQSSVDSISDESVLSTIISIMNSNLLPFIAKIIKNQKITDESEKDILKACQNFFVSSPEATDKFFYNSKGCFGAENLGDFFVKISEVRNQNPYQISTILSVFKDINSEFYAMSFNSLIDSPKTLKKFKFLENLWTLYDSTKNEKLSEFLAKLYLESEDAKDIGCLIDHCLSRICDEIQVLKKVIDDCVSKHNLETFGLETSKVHFESEYSNVTIVGDKKGRIRVLNSITFQAFSEAVAVEIGTSVGCLSLFYGASPIRETDFNVSEIDEVSVKIWGGNRSQELPENFPILTLSSQKNSDILFETMHNKELGETALAILEYLPTHPKAYSMLLKEGQFGSENPYLFKYLCDIAGSTFLKDENIEDIKEFCNNGGACKLFKECLKCEGIFFLSIGLTLIERCPEEQAKRSMINELSLDKDLMKYSQSEPQVKLLSILADANPLVFDGSKQYHELFKTSIFCGNRRMRELMAGLAIKVPPPYEQLVEMLKEVPEERCLSFFAVLSNSVIHAEDPLDVFDAVEELFNSRFPSSDSYASLSRNPAPKFTEAILKFAALLISKWPSNSESLFDIILQKIILSKLRYYNPPNQIFDALLQFLKNHKNAGERLKTLYINSLSQSLPTSFDMKSVSMARWRGLKNLGCTCYMNSTLQQFFYIKEFRQAILQPHFQSDQWISQLQNIYAQLLLLPTSYVDPSGFVKLWKWWGEPVNPHEQQDAVEFVQMFIDKANDLIPGISKLFTGTIFHHTVGMAVDFDAESIESFVTFPLEVKGLSSVEDSLKSFLLPDIFTGPNQYSSETLGKIDAKRYHRIQDSPPILILQLKRFTYNLQTGDRKKINSKYTFPHQLDISSIMKDSSQPNIYDLIGVIMHSGSANGGHYYTYCRTDTKRWICCNDDIVKPFDQSKLPSIAEGGSVSYSDSFNRSSSSIFEYSDNAYILLYRQCKEEEKEDPKIDQTILQATLSQIETIVTQRAEEDQMYQSFKLTSAELIGDVKVLFALSKKALRSAPEIKAFNDSLKVFLSFVSRSPELCRSFISDSVLHYDIFFTKDNEAIRVAYSKALESVIQPYFEDYLAFLRVQIPICFKKWQFLDEFLLPFKSVIGSLKATSEWVALLSTTLAESIAPSLKESNRLVKISCFFDILTTLIKKGDFFHSIHPELVTPKLINKLLISDSARISISKFLKSYFEEYPSMISQFYECVFSEEIGFEGKSYAMFAVVGLGKTDISWFLTNFPKKFPQTLQSFLENFLTIASETSADAAPLFSSNAKSWITSCLLSKNEKIRSATVDIVSSLNIGKEIAPILLDSLPLLTDHLTKSLTFYELPSSFPSRHYFVLLKWALSTNPSPLFESSKDLIKSLEKITECRGSNTSFRSAFLGFLSEFIDRKNSCKFFQKEANFNSFIKCFSEMNYDNYSNAFAYADSATVFRIVPEEFVSTFVTSEFFSRCLLVGFNGDQPLSRELVNFFEGDAVSKIIPKLTKLLFNQTIVDNNLSGRASRFLEVLLFLFTKYPSTVTAFASEDREYSLFRYVQNCGSVYSNSETEIKSKAAEVLAVIITTLNSCEGLKGCDVGKAIEDSLTKETMMRVSMLHLDSALASVSEEFLMKSSICLKASVFCGCGDDEAEALGGLIGCITLRAKGSKNISEISESIANQLEVLMKLKMTPFKILPYFCEAIDTIITDEKDWQGKEELCQEVSASLMAGVRESTDVQLFSPKLQKLANTLISRGYANKKVIVEKCNELLRASVGFIVTMKADTISEPILRMVKYGMEFLLKNGEKLGASSDQPWLSFGDICSQLNDPNSVDVRNLMAILCKP